MTDSTADKATSGSGRVIRLRHVGQCGCGVQLPAGSKAHWDTDARAITCLATQALSQGLRRKATHSGLAIRRAR